MGFIFQWLLDEAINGLAFCMELIYIAVSSSIFNNVFIQFILIIFTTLAGVSLVLGLVPAITNYVVEKNVTINQLIKNILTGSIFAVSFSAISTAVYQIGFLLTSETLKIMASASSLISNDNLFNSWGITESIGKISGMGITFKLIVIVLMLVYLVIICWQQYVRAVDLLVYQFQGVLSVYSLVQGNTSAFKTYLNGVLALTVTQSIQIMFLYAGLTTVRTDGIFSMFMALAFFVVAVKLPQKMKEWSYSTGTAKGMSALSQTAMQTFTTIRMASLMK